MTVVNSIVKANPETFTRYLAVKTAYHSRTFLTGSTCVVM
jgi:hypothetical protein